MLKQFVPGGLHPAEGTHTGAVQEELQPIGEVCGGQSYQGGTPCWSRSRVGGILLLRRKELETVCDELITNPLPCLLALLWKGGSREFGNEVKSRKKGGVEGRCF